MRLRFATLLLFLLGGVGVPVLQAQPLPNTPAVRSGAGPLPTPIARHEPLFGFGPRTIWANGWGFEVGLDRDKAEREESWGLDYHVLYGLTANWSVTAEVHQVLTGTGDHSSGLSDLMIRSKYRFFCNDVPGGVYHAAVLGGVEFPTATAGLREQSSTDGFGGLSGAYEGRRWLLFLTGRYRVNSEGADDVKPGNAFLYDAALGLRPVLTGYYQPDVVLMGELNGQVFGLREVKGADVAGSAGDRLLAAVGAWMTYRNWAIKPGIQVPVFGVVPILDKNLDVTTPQGRVERGPTGIGDARFFARYTVWTLNRAGQTQRLAPLAGVEAPTGDDDATDDFGRLPQPLQLGSGSWDPFAGVVFTWQTLQWQVDVSSLYQMNTATNRFEFGDELRLDVASKYRLWVNERSSGIPGFFYANLEMNLIWQGNNEGRGQIDPNSGGKAGFVAPGLQYITQRVVLEGAAQLPLIQDLNGAALERDFITTLSIRINI